MYHNNHSKVFKIWYIITEILFFALAVISGFIFEETDIWGDRSYNWLWAIGIYISSIPITAILYAIYSHLENQEIQIDLSGEIVEELRKRNNNQDINQDQ